MLLEFNTFNYATNKVVVFCLEEKLIILDHEASSRQRIIITFLLQGLPMTHQRQRIISHIKTAVEDPQQSLMLF